MLITLEGRLRIIAKKRLITKKLNIDINFAANVGIQVNKTFVVKSDV